MFVCVNLNLSIFKVMVNKRATSGSDNDSSGIALDTIQHQNDCHENNSKGHIFRRDSTAEVESAIVAIETTLRQHEQAGGDNNNIPNPFVGFLEAFTRKKPLDGRTDTHLNRCLNLLDLTTLGKPPKNSN